MNEESTEITTPYSREEQSDTEPTRFDVDVFWHAYPLTFGQN